MSMHWPKQPDEVWDKFVAIHEELGVGIEEKFEDLEDTEQKAWVMLLDWLEEEISEHIDDRDYEIMQGEDR